jgi:hypothetical protein
LRGPARRHSDGTSQEQIGKDQIRGKENGCQKSKTGGQGKNGYDKKEADREKNRQKSLSDKNYRPQDATV